MIAPYTKQFGHFWHAYPRKTGKGAAWQVFQKLGPTDHDVQVMLDALAWQRDQPQWQKHGGEFIPLPKTWLRQRRWEDEPFEVAPKPRYYGWTCPHTPPCEQRHWCELKTAKAVLGGES